MAQIGSFADPICRLRSLPDGVAIPGKLEYDVKVALLFRCLEMVQWPQDSFNSPKARLRIGILGKNPFGDSLDSLADKTVHGRKLVIKNPSHLSPSSRFQIIFLPSCKAAEFSEILSSLSAQPVLTVGESPGFTEQGGMINLRLEGKNIRFEVNQRAAAKAGISLDPKLVKLAEALAAPPPQENASPATAVPKS